MTEQVETLGTVRELQDRARQFMREGFTVLRMIDTAPQHVEPDTVGCNPAFPDPQGPWVGYVAFRSIVKGEDDVHRMYLATDAPDLPTSDPLAIYRDASGRLSGDPGFDRSTSAWPSETP